MSTRTAPLGIERISETLVNTWSMEGHTGLTISSLYPDDVQSRVECWQDIVLELNRRLAFFENETAEKIEMMKEPLKRELRRAAMELQEMIRWNEIVERQRDEAKRQLPPRENEIENLQNTLDCEIQHHFAARDELRMLKEAYHQEIQQWEDQLAAERQARTSSMKQLDAEIADLKMRRVRAEQLMEDQKKSLEWKDEVINKYKRELSRAESAADKFERQAESLQRQLNHSVEERQREKDSAEAKLQSTVQVLTEQHQLGMAAVDQARKRERTRHAVELEQKDAELSDLCLQHAAVLTNQREELEERMRQELELAHTNTREVMDTLYATETALGETKRMLRQEKEAHTENVERLTDRLGRIDAEWSFRLGEVSQALEASQIRYQKEEASSTELRAQISAIEQDHWKYQTIDKTAGPHIYYERAGLTALAL